MDTRLLCIALRQSLPACGVYALGWPIDVVVFFYWFDGACAAAVLAARAGVHHGHRLDPEVTRGAPPVVATGFATTFLLIAFLLPYFIAFLVLERWLLEPGLAGRVLEGDATSLGMLALIPILHGIEVWQRSRDTFADWQREQLYLLVLRAAAMFTAGLVARSAIVPVLALLLTIVEWRSQWFARTGPKWPRAGL